MKIERLFKPSLGRLIWVLLVFALPLKAMSFAVIPNKDSVLHILRSIESGEKLFDPGHSIDLLYQAGEALITNSPDSALYWYERAFEVAKSNDRVASEGMLLNRMGYAYYVLGDYNHALPMFQQALAIHQSQGNDVGISTSFNHIGLIYEAQGNFEQALISLWESVKYSKKANNAERLISNFYNLAMTHQDWHDYDSALSYLTRAITMSKEEGNSRMLAMSYNRLGEIYRMTGNNDQAEESYRASLQLQAADNKWEACFSYSGLARLYLQRGEYDASVESGLKSYQLAKQLKAKWEIAESSEALYEAYKLRGDFRNALAMLEESKLNNDLLFNEEKDKEINLLHLRQNESQKDQLLKENLIQKAAIEQSNLWIGFFVVVVILLGIWGLAMYQNSKQKLVLNEQLKKKTQKIAERNARIQEQNTKLSELNEVKNQLLSIIGHDMRSPINNIQTILKIIKDGKLSASDQEVVFNELHKAVNSVADTMNNMLMWASSQLNGVQIRPEITNVRDLVEETLKIFIATANNKHIEIDHQQREDIFVTVDAEHLKTALRNLIGNALKFTKRNGKVTISYSAVEDNMVGIRIIDTGIGIAREQIGQIFTFKGRSQSVGTSNERGTGIGLMLSKQFIESNNGKIQVDSWEGIGSEFTILLPAAIMELASPQPA